MAALTENINIILLISLLLTKSSFQKFVGKQTDNEVLVPARTTPSSVGMIDYDTETTSVSIVECDDYDTVTPSVSI